MRRGRVPLLFGALHLGSLNQNGTASGNDTPFFEFDARHPFCFDKKRQLLRLIEQEYTPVAFQCAGGRLVGIVAYRFPRAIPYFTEQNLDSREVGSFHTWREHDSTSVQTGAFVQMTF